MAPAVPAARKRRTAVAQPTTASARFTLMRSSSSRVDAGSTEASRNTAALLTQPASGAAACAASGARSVTASSPASPTTAVARSTPSSHANADGSSSIATTASPSASSRSTIARPIPRPPPATRPTPPRPTPPPPPVTTCERAKPDSVELLVGRDGEELGELVGQRDLLEQGLRLPRTALGLEPLAVADLRADALELLVLQPPDQIGRDRRAVVLERAPVADPLPHLRARDLGGGRVLHEPVDAGGAVAAQPRGDVLDPHVDVAAQPGLGDRPGGGGDVEQLGRADVDVVALAVDLVGAAAQDLVELGHRGLDHVGVRHPGAVEARGGLALLVGRHRLDRALVGLGVLARGDQRGHAAHGMRAAPVARLDQQLAVGLHEGHGHLHVVAVGQDELRPLAEGLDGREDVVPAPRVQRAGVRAQLVEDLLHLEGGGQRLDEHGRLDGAAVEPQLALDEGEDLRPQPRLAVRLHLGQVEERARALLEQALGIAHEVEAGVDEGARDRLAVDAPVLLDQVPAARADEQRGHLVTELVLAAVLAGELDRALDRVGQVDL